MVYQGLPSSSECKYLHMTNDLEEVAILKHKDIDCSARLNSALLVAT